MRAVFEVLAVVLIVATISTMAVFAFSERKQVRDTDRVVVSTVRDTEDRRTGDERREEAHPEIFEEEPVIEPEPTPEPEQIPEAPSVLPTEPEPIVETPEPDNIETTLNRQRCDQLLDASAFYMDPHMTVIRLERQHRHNGETEIADKLLEISCYPQATWLTWSDADSMRERVEEVTRGAEAKSQIPVFVIYNSPDYNTPHWYVGNQGQDYLDWIEEVAKGAGDRVAWFIIEPDALGLSTDYSEEDKKYRQDELSAVVSIIKETAVNARVYLDAGHNVWKTPEIFAELLRGSGIDKADGFVQNISNYQDLDKEIARATELSNLLNGKHFIIDTSRNGVGAPSDHEWCNARGRALGVHPTMNTGNPLIDAFLWVKPPGESDGTCNDGPTPGRFWLEYALELVDNAQ